MGPQDNGASPDAFFVLRDSRAMLRDGLYLIAEKAGAPRVALQAFAEAFDAAHDEMVAAKPRTGFDATRGLTASRITLVSESDLELDIRLGGLAKRLVDIGGSALWRVHARYMTLLKRREMAPDENPAGPEAICRGLLGLCKESALKPEAMLDLLARIEADLAEHLPRLYGELNDLLASRNVAPAQVQGTTTGGPRRAPQAREGAREAGRPDPFAALQALLAHQGGGVGGPAAAGSAAAGAEPLAGGTGAASGNDIPALGGGFPALGGGAGQATLNAAALTMLNQLAERIDQLAAATAAVGAATGAAGSAGMAGAAAGAGVPALPENAAAPDEVPHAIQAADIGAPLGQPAAVAVDTLALIFSIIFETWDLPDTVKTAIGRLQFPFVKLALFDPTLFSDRDHPARRLINGMARAACGLPRSLPRAHRVSTRLWQIAGAVKDTLGRDAGALAAPLADVDSLVAERDAGVFAAAQPYISLLRNKEAHDQAAQAVRRWLGGVEARGGPEPILAFLRLHWVRVMEAAWLDSGEAGEVWRAGDATVADLMWSVRPKTRAEDRTALARSVPNLLRRLGAALDRVGISAESRQPFLDALFALQTAALRGAPAADASAPTPPAAVAAEPPPAAADDESRLAIEVIEADGLQLQTLGLAGGAAGAARGEPDVEVGEWIEFRLEGDEPRCGLVCWRNPRSGSLLAFNPDWGRAIALSAPVLARQLGEGQAAVVSGRLLFDLAAERALGRLQEVAPA